MLHKISLPTYDQSLERILQFQATFLAFLCDPDTPDQPDIADFKCYFNDAIGSWFYKRLRGRRKDEKKTLYAEVCKVLSYIKSNSAKCNDIIQAFAHDKAFIEHLKDESFEFAFYWMLDPTTRAMLKPILVAFYETLFYTGFPASIQGFAPTFDRKRFLQFFWDTNEALQVCPACDAPRPDIKDYYHCNVDHFLPKSLYPFLVLHAANLVPLCTDCNQYIKGDKDPLDAKLAISLVEIFHPFGKPALEEIRIVVYRNTKGKPAVRLEEKPGGTSRRIQQLDYVYELEKRWNGRLKQRMISINNKLLSAARSAKKSTWSAEEIVENILEEELALWDEKVGRDEWYLLTSSYVYFAQHDDKERTTMIEAVAARKSLEG